MLFPILQLNARLTKSTTSLYGSGILGFEVTHVAFVAAGWLGIAIVLALETQLGVVRKGMWIIRVLTLFSLATLTVRLELLLALYSHTAYNYDMYLFLAQYAVVALSSLVAVSWWPTRFVETEYRLVPVQDVIDSEDVEETDAKVCPESKVGIVSRLLFNWMSPLVKLGYKKPLDSDDVWVLANSDRCEAYPSLSLLISW